MRRTALVLRFDRGWRSFLSAPLSLISWSACNVCAGEADAAAGGFGELATPQQMHWRDALAAQASDPGEPPAEWRRGRIKTADGWKTADEYARAAAADPRLAEYRRLRDSLGDSTAAHLKLARYAQTHDLHGQARAHWTRVLAEDPEHRTAQRALGLRSVDGRLLTAEQREHRERIAGQRRRDLVDWRRHTRRWRFELASADPDRRREALADMAETADATSLDALVELAGVVDAEAAETIVGVVGAMTDGAATETLTHWAIDDPRPAIRAAAIDELSRRPVATVAPLALAAMEMPIQLRTEVRETNGPAILLQQVAFQDGAEVATKKTRTTRVAFARSRPQSNAEFLFRTARLSGQVRRAVDAEAASVENQTARYNNNVKRRNARAGALLTRISDEEHSNDPVAWRRWWMGYNERRLAMYRPLREYSDYRSVAVPVGFERLSTSCFVAGTVVWTETGAVPIERIRVGDCVLAQDAATGELAHKPVMAVTVTPQCETLRLEVAGESLEATRGHPFWRMGDGWTMAKNLRPGDPVCALGRVATVDAIEPCDEQEVFNLMVADFGTYFVGKQRLLVHDGELPTPVDRVAPGVAREDVSLAGAE